MLTEGDLVVVAVSGGPDSMCLLDILCSLATEFGIDLYVAHLNHHMREQAKEDAEMVREFAGSLGVGCTVGDADVNAIAALRGIGVEEAGREARYDFLRRVMRDLRAQKIALGHNRNDQAETVLMRLLRGAGTEGLAGIPPVNGEVVRPLIDVPRNLIEQYCVTRNIPTMLDVYNLDEKYTRNAIRLSLLPELEKRFNPSILTSLAETATVLRWDAELLSRMANERFLVDSAKVGRMTSVDRNAIHAMPSAISSRVLELAWRECSGSGSSLPLRRVQELLYGDKDVVTLPEEVTCERTVNAYRFFPKVPADVCVELKEDGETQVPELGLSFVMRTVAGTSRDVVPAKERSVATGCVPWDNLSMFTEPLVKFDRNKVRGPLFVRIRREGDKFKPFGMGGSEQKIQDFLVQRKVPRFYRDFVPLVHDSSDIVWVAGLRLSDNYRVDPETTCITEVELRPYLRCSRNYATIQGSCPAPGRAYS